MTAALGTLFLAGQAWGGKPLVGHGLTLSGAPHPAFSLLIGAHGAHVLVGVVWLWLTLVKARPFSPRDLANLELSGMYWAFGVGLWAVLFPLVSLA